MVKIITKHDQNHSAFPNYEVDKTHDNPLQHSHQIELEIARNCQNVKSMILDLDAHQKRQISEMEKDLASRQEKHLGEPFQIDMIP